MPADYAYLAYGLRIASAIELPELIDGDSAAQPDVIVRRSQSPLLHDECLHLGRDPGMEVGPESRSITLRYPDGVSFVVSPGTQVSTIDVDTRAGGEKDARSYLLGPVLGLLLRLRGRAALHASGAVIGSKAIAIAGPSGAGKSTLANAIGALGCPILCDDIFALDYSGPEWLALPGYPRIRLHQEGEQARYHVAPEQGTYQFCDRPTALNAIYVLEAPADSPRFRSLHGADAQMALTPLVYGVELMSRRLHVEAVDWLARLVSDVPIRRFRPLRGDPVKSAQLLMQDRVLAEVAR